MRVLMPSIVDPAEKRGGAWAVTSGLIKAMETAWPECEVECIALRSLSRHRHRIRRAKSAIASLVAGGLPAKMRFQRRRLLCDRIQEALAAHSPDVIVLNGGDLLWLLSELPDTIPKIVVAHNVEHVLYQRQIANIPLVSRAVARILKRDSELLREMELDGLRSATATVFLSEEDLVTVSDAIGAINAIVIPPSFDYEPLARSHSVSGPLRLGMFADFEWWPNRRGLDWFVANVWPDVAHTCELQLFGHGSDEAAQGVGGVTRHGFVNHARDVFPLCDLMIAPIDEGAGIKVKVAEALYNGVPVVAMPAAVSRMFTESNPALKICADANDWIQLLSGPGAARLARERVPPALREAFTIDAAVQRLRSVWPQGVMLPTPQ